MGTNYYLKMEPCPHCGRGDEEIHLGKSSCGWKFLFHKTNRIKNFKQFCKAIQSGTILDEYGQEHSVEYMLDLIKSKQGESDHVDCECIDGYDFLSEDFC